MADTTTPTPAPAATDTVQERHDDWQAKHAASVLADKATADARNRLAAALKLVNHPVVLRASDGTLTVLTPYAGGFTSTPARDASIVVPSAPAK